MPNVKWREREKKKWKSSANNFHWLFFSSLALFLKCMEKRYILVRIRVHVLWVCVMCRPVYFIFFKDIFSSHSLIGTCNIIVVVGRFYSSIIIISHRMDNIFFWNRVICLRVMYKTWVLYSIIIINDQKLSSTTTNIKYALTRAKKKRKRKTDDLGDDDDHFQNKK